MAYLPNRTSVVIAVYLRRKLTFTANLFILVPDQFDAFSTRKTSQETNAITNTPPCTGQLEKRTSSLSTDVV